MTFSAWKPNKEWKNCHDLPALEFQKGSCSLLGLSTLDRTGHRVSSVTMLLRWTMAGEGQTDHKAVRTRSGPSVSPMTITEQVPGNIWDGNHEELSTQFTRLAPSARPCLQSRHPACSLPSKLSSHLFLCPFAPLDRGLPGSKNRDPFTSVPSVLRHQASAVVLVAYVTSSFSQSGGLCYAEAPFVHSFSNVSPAPTLCRAGPGAGVWAGGT